MSPVVELSILQTRLIGSPGSICISKVEGELWIFERKPQFSIGVDGLVTFPWIVVGIGKLEGAARVGFEET